MFSYISNVLGALARDIEEGFDSLAKDISEIGDEFEKGYKEGLITTPEKPIKKPTKAQKLKRISQLKAEIQSIEGQP